MASFPVPQDIPSIELTDNARTILEKRYLRRGPNMKPVETVDEMLARVASHVAAVESTWGATEDEVHEVFRSFYRLISEKRFFPNSPTFTGAGTPLGQLAACFVLPIADDMGRQEDGIMSTLRNAALIQQTGGGNGFSFSRLRQKGAFVKTSGGTSTGPVGFLKVYDQAFGMIAQGGTRRGANMAVLRVDHPDIMEFIACKANETHITNFNISVGLTDEFMRAVRDDTDFPLIAPNTKEVVSKVRAREIFDTIVRFAHHNGEPGVLFLDTANRQNPVPHLYELESTNPCGEQWLGPYENCCLGSVNLAQHARNGHIDWKKLEETTRLATQFLDDVVEANAYVPAVPQLRKAAMQCRRIGLGIMGLADLMYEVGVRYGSAESEVLAGVVMEFVRYITTRTSVELAEKRGAFPEFQKSALKEFTAPTPLPPRSGIPYQHWPPQTWGRPNIDWASLEQRVRKGIRNAALTTIAPTGTIASVAGIEGYGCEPVFALAYMRHVNDNGKDLVLPYSSPSLKRALEKAGIPEEDIRLIEEEAASAGSIQNVDSIPEFLKNVFAVSGDILPEEHVRMQASLQAFVDNSLSKTCNLPEGATEQDVAKCYMLAWELGCKGLTVYVTGSRQTVVLETKKEAKKKESAASETATTTTTTTSSVADSAGSMSKKPRAKKLLGCTHMISTPVGKTYVTINEEGGQPFEAFVNTAKAGSETSAVSEAFGRLISYILRVHSIIEPRQRLLEVYNQLSGIGGRRAMGFGRNRVQSLPDGIAQAIYGYLDEGTEEDNSYASPIPDTVASAPAVGRKKIGDLCPDCGDCALINEEGCKKCYSCGYSEC